MRQALDLRLMNFPGTYSIKTYCQNHAGYAMYVVMLCMLCLVCWFWWLWMVYLTCWICLVKINHVRVVGLFLLPNVIFRPWLLSCDFRYIDNWSTAAWSGPPSPTRYTSSEGRLINWPIELNTKNSTKRQQSCRLVEFLVFNSAFGRHSN